MEPDIPCPTTPRTGCSGNKAEFVSVRSLSKMTGAPVARRFQVVAGTHPAVGPGSRRELAGMTRRLMGNCAKVTGEVYRSRRNEAPVKPAITGFNGRGWRHGRCDRIRTRTKRPGPKKTAGIGDKTKAGYGEAVWQPCVDYQAAKPSPKTDAPSYEENSSSRRRSKRATLQVHRHHRFHPPKESCRGSGGSRGWRHRGRASGRFGGRGHRRHGRRQRGADQEGGRLCGERRGKEESGRAEGQGSGDQGREIHRDQSQCAEGEAGALVLNRKGCDQKAACQSKSFSPSCAGEKINGGKEKVVTGSAPAFQTST
jgi:hypothetical protein